VIVCNKRCDKYKYTTRHRAIHEKLLGLFHFKSVVEGLEFVGGICRGWWSTTLKKNVEGVNKIEKNGRGSK
jgi:hypothetical protein